MTTDLPAERPQHGGWATPGLGWACAIAILLRLPTFRYPLVSDDEAIYDAMAQAITHGGVMYRDTVDHKPPGLAYTYAAVHGLVTRAGGSFAAVMTSVHVAGLATVVLTCLALYAIARELLERRLWSLPPLLYAVASATSVPPDSLAVNGELVMNLPTALAVVCALRGSRPSTPARSGLAWWAAGGALTAVAALYKYQAAFAGVALALLALESLRGARARVLRVSARLLLLAAGFAAVFAVVGFGFWHARAFTDALTWGVGFNVHYLAEGPDLRTAASRLAMQLLGVVLPSVVLYAGAVVGLARRLRPLDRAAEGELRGRWFLIAWVGVSVYSVTLGRRFFGHYFLQPELPMAVLAAGPLAEWWRRHPRVVAASVAAPAAVFLAIASAPELTARYVYAVDPDYWALGRAVSARTRPSDTIWVWGNVPQIYFTAERAPGVRFTFCNYLTGLSPGSRSEFDPTYDPRRNAVPGAWDLVVHDLDANHPAVIVDTAAGRMKSYGKFPVDAFPVLADYLRAHYRPDAVVNGAVIYVRRDG